MKKKKRKLDRFKKSDILIDMMRTVKTLKVSYPLIKGKANAVSKTMWHKSYNTFDSIQERSGEL